MKRSQPRSLPIWRPTCKRLTRKMPSLILFLTSSLLEIETKATAAYLEFYKTWMKEHTTSSKGHAAHRYVICLDDSGSMSGQRFKAASQAVKEFAEGAKAINQGTASAVSLVMFSGTSRVACNKTPLEKHSECTGSITYQPGWGTTFVDPLQDAMRLIEKGKDKYDKQFIMFYTDGQAIYPNNEVEHMKSFMVKFPGKLEFFAISESDSDALTGICTRLYPSSPLSEHCKSLVKPQQISTAIAADLAPNEHGICSSISLDMMPVPRAGCQPFSSSKTPQCSA